MLQKILEKNFQKGSNNHVYVWKSSISLFSICNSRNIMLIDLFLRRVIITEKVKLLLTLYRPLPTPLFHLVKPKLLALPPLLPKSQQKLYSEWSFSCDGTPQEMLLKWGGWHKQLSTIRVKLFEKLFAATFY